MGLAPVPEHAWANVCFDGLAPRSLLNSNPSFLLLSLLPFLFFLSFFSPSFPFASDLSFYSLTMFMHIVYFGQMPSP